MDTATVVRKHTARNKYARAAIKFQTWKNPIDLPFFVCSFLRFFLYWCRCCCCCRQNIGASSFLRDRRLDGLLLVYILNRNESMEKSQFIHFVFVCVCFVRTRESQHLASSKNENKTIHKCECLLRPLLPVFGVFWKQKSSMISLDAYRIVSDEWNNAQIE